MVVVGGGHSLPCFSDSGPKRGIGMPNTANSISSVYPKVVKERHAEFLRDMNGLFIIISIIGVPNGPQRVERAEAALKSALALQAVLPKDIIPPWLPLFVTSLTNYIKNKAHQSCGNKLMNVIALYYAAAASQEWKFDFSDDGGFDFNRVFHEYATESRISELFDKLIELLERIVSCEELDSRKVVSTLERIIATLKKNRNGSYYDKIWAWNFTRLYAKHLFCEIAEKMSYIGIPATALRKTLEELRETCNELDEEMGAVNGRVRDDLRTQLSVDFPMLEYEALPLPKLPAIADETIVDVDG